MNDSQRRRATVRDQGLRRASTTTGWVAVGGIAATALAAVVFAQVPAAGAIDDTPGDAPGVAVPGPADQDGPAPTASPGAGSPVTTTPHRSHHSSGGSSGQVLQSPATPVVPVAPRAHAHVSSGSS